MKLKTFIIFLAFFILILVALLIYITPRIVPVDMNVKNITFHVPEGNGIGFDVSRDKFSFGIVCQNCSGKRKFFVANNANYDQKVTFYVAMKSLEASRWITVIPGSQIINPHQSETFTMYLAVPPDAPPGYYEGKFMIIITKPWPWDTKNPYGLPPPFSPLLARNLGFNV